jgi:hypothetical protein
MNDDKPHDKEDRNATNQDTKGTNKRTNDFRKASFFHSLNRVKTNMIKG